MKAKECDELYDYEYTVMENGQAQHARNELGSCCSNDVAS